MADILDIDAAVIGAGPAGLMAAEQLARGGLRVTVFDGMGAPARKFLLAGRGGLNLTHSEAKPDFLSRYGAAQARLAPAIEAFGPQQLRAWADDLGQRTFVGSSGRVFPVAMKASPLLRAWLRRLDAQGVQLRLKHRWTGWDGEGKAVGRHAGRIARHRGAGDGAGARRRELAEARLGWKLERFAGCQGHHDRAAAASELRLRRRVVGAVRRQVSGRAAEECGAIVRHSHCPRRGGDHP